MAILLLLAAGGCHQGERGAQSQAGAGDGYVSPPAVTEARPAGASVVLSGAAPAGAEVRLATPQGQSLTTRADADGRWTLQLGAAPQARIFGLSAGSDGRKVQAQGYLLIGPRGETALLRAGSGAVRFDRPRGSRITAVDFDADGGAMVSGRAQAGTDVAVRLDGKALGDARADEAGRFSYALPRLAAGAHRIETTGVGFTDDIAFDATPAQPLVSGPLHSQLTGRGLRADWLTPGGGVQSTILAG